MTKAEIPEAIDTFRILWDLMDFSEADGEGWNILIDLNNQTAAIGADWKARITLLSWMLRVAVPDIKDHYFEHPFNFLLGWLLLFKEFFEDGTIHSFLQLDNGRAIEARASPGGYTNLHYKIAVGDSIIAQLLNYKPDLHCIGLDHIYSDYPESPTSLALNSSFAFALWRDALEEAEVDIESFITTEMQQTPLIEAGWTVETLSAIFTYKFDTLLNLHRSYYCVNCSKIPSIRVQPYWMQITERIRAGLDPDDVSESLDMEEYEEENPLAINEVKMDTAMNPDANSEELEEYTHPTCAYRKDEILCMQCWVRYKETGHRQMPRECNDESRSEPGDEEPDDEFSPFHVHA